MIGQRLKKIRGKLSQAEFAKLLGIPLLSYGRYEREEREMPIEIILKAAQIGQVSVDYLLKGWDDNITPVESPGWCLIGGEVILEGSAAWRAAEIVAGLPADKQKIAISIIETLKERE